MSARTIVDGAYQRHVRKTSANGNAYALVTVREASGDATRWWTAFVFNEDAIAQVERLQRGEPIAIAGEIDASIFAPDNGKPRVSLSIRVDGVLTARKPPKKAPDKRLRSAARAACADEPNDDIPF